MDDNKPKDGENQLPPDNASPLPGNPDKPSSSSEQKTADSDRPKPIYETISQEQHDKEQIQNQGNGIPPTMQAEEVPPDVLTPDQAVNSPAQAPPSTPPGPRHSPPWMKFALIGGSVLFFILIFMGILKLFFGGSGASKEPVTLQYWGLWEEKQTMEPLIAEYQQKNPHIKIEYQKMAPSEYRDKLIARGNKGPDIFRFHNTWLPQIQEVASPIPSSVMTESEFDKTFYPIHKKDLQIGKNYFGIPLSIDGYVLVYNNGLFKKAGISKAPVTWEDIANDISKLYSGKDKDGQLLSSPIAIGTATNIEHFSAIFGLMLVQNGGDIRKLDQPEAAGALESYRKFAEPPTEYWNDSMPSSVAAFTQEKVAMIIVPSWEILQIKTANPDLEIKVVGVPRLPAAKPISIASYWVEGVSRFSKNQTEAWKFLKFLSEKDSQTKMFKEQSKGRLFGSAYSRVDLGSTLSQNEYLAPVIAQANDYVSLPLIARTHDNGMNDEIVKYLENAINSTVQGVSYGEALRVAAQGVTQVYQRFKIE